MLLATSNVTKGVVVKCQDVGNWMSIDEPNRPLVRIYGRKTLFSGGSYVNGKHTSISLYKNTVTEYSPKIFDSLRMTHLATNLKQGVQDYQELRAKKHVPPATQHRLTLTLKKAGHIRSRTQKAGRMRRGTKVLSSGPGGKTLKQCRVEAIALFKKQMKEKHKDYK